MQGVYHLLVSIIVDEYTEKFKHRQIPYISRTLVGDKLVDHPDVGAVPTTSLFST